ncbi:hypothetical protein HN873_053198, partial [Arachis hypogaea]
SYMLDSLFTWKFVKGSEKIQGIMLDLPEKQEVQLSDQDFRKLKNLRMLIIRNAEFSGGHVHLPRNLRLLDWKEYPSPSLPSDFLPEKIVMLELQHSHLYTLEESFKYAYLTSLNFSSCESLSKIPDVSGIPNLEQLILEDCTSLVDIHESIGSLDKLVYLGVERCTELKNLPSVLKLPSLGCIALNGCSQLEKFPELLGEMENLRIIEVEETALQELPSCIINFSSLEVLVLKCCSNLKELPINIDMLPNLQLLDMSGCPQLQLFTKKLRSFSTQNCSTMPAESDKGSPNLELLPSPPCLDPISPSIHSSYGFPLLENLELSDCNLSDEDLHILSCFSNLASLDISRNHFVTLPKCFNRLYMSMVPNLESLSIDNCKSLIRVHESVGTLNKLVTLNLMFCSNLNTLPTRFKLKSLRNLLLTGCSKLRKFPEIVENMEHLEEILLQGTAIKELPQSIEYLVGLKSLFLDSCQNLEHLPSSIQKLQYLTTLNLSYCSKLQELPKLPPNTKYLDINFSMVPNLESLSLDNCRSLIKVHESVGTLDKLVTLNLLFCSNLKTFPSRFMLKSLRTLLLTGCSKLKKFPEIVGNMEHLEEILLQGTAIKELPQSIEYLSGLKSLFLESCQSLEHLPSSLQKLQNLTILDLSGCSKLQKIPKLPLNTRYIDLSNCRSLTSFPTLSSISNFIAEDFPRFYQIRFVNCHKLDMMLPEYISCEVVLPGSKIPDWFQYQSTNNSIYLEVSSGLYGKPMEVFFGAVFELDKGVTTTGLFASKFDVIVNDIKINMSTSYFEALDSSHVWLSRLKLDHFMWHLKSMRQWNHFQISFSIFETSSKEKIGATLKSCGFHVWYNQEGYGIDHTTVRKSTG